MKRIYCLLIPMFLLTACGDDNSSKSPVQAEYGESSSSVELDSSSKKSSSSIREDKYSSSVKESSSSKKEDKSSSERNSSSVKEDKSSSSEKNSSSVKEDKSSSSEKSSSSKIFSSSSEDNTSSEPKSSSSEKSSSSSELSSSSETMLSSISESSSSSVIATPCKTETEDNCIYGTLYDDRDGKIYKTVKIGNQEWMAENLNFEYNEGSAKSFCYKNDTTNCTTYGRLYNWSAAIDSISYYNEYNKQCGWKQSKCSIPTLWKGICPNGSHIPSLDEWKDLLSNLDSTIAGKVLKSLEYWSDGKNGTDLYGFSVLPSGEWGGSNYMNKGKESVFWIASDFSKESAYNIIFSYDSDKVLIMNDWKTFDYSVRCIKD